MKKTITNPIVRTLFTMILATFVMLTATIASAAESCVGSWAEGMTLRAGDTVSFNGHNYQRNGRYVGINRTPTSRDLYTDLGACSPNNNAGNPPGPTVGAEFCAASWTEGTTLKAGDTVSFNGHNYQRNGKYVGINRTPTSRDLYTDLGPCSPRNGTTQLRDFPVTEAQFNQMFPNRNALYTYAALMEARKKFGSFGTIGSDIVRKQEIAAFLANVAVNSAELAHTEELNTLNRSDYCDPSNTPCQAGKQYFGRGPIQLRWNYNYRQMGMLLNLPLLQRPELVSTDPKIAWQTSILAWMIQPGSGKRPPHATMVNKKGFGDTIRSINGALECNGRSIDQVRKRIGYYQKFTQMLGVPAGENLGC